MPVVSLAAAAFLAGYAVGSVPFGYLVARWRGVDIFRQGSGNIGATNVGRILGRRLGILVFFLDFLKGAGPTLAGLWLERMAGAAVRDGLWPGSLGLAAGLGAFLGHLFPVYLRFRGGKGVATGAGVIAVLVPGPALGAIVCWVGMLCAAQYVSLASLAAAVALCAMQLLSADPFADGRAIITLFCLLAAALVFLRHRANLARLLQGSENRFPEGALMVSFSKTVHVLALALWFGTVVFFTFAVALTIFHTFETAGADSSHRPPWFPLPEAFRATGGPVDGPKEQGTRAAGYVLGPLFGWYFLIQGACGFLAVATALPWPRLEPRRKAHRVRVALLLAALVTVLAGWPLERRVGELRTPRNDAVDHYLQNADNAEARQAAAEAKSEFGLWHLGSVLLNLVTVVLVTAAMALAAQLPDRNVRAVADTARPEGDRQAVSPDPAKALTHS
jgi:acyl-phosphate glycerol 3-phosphate acyltransferase